MPRLPRVKAKIVIRTLERLGFTQVSQKGSHVKMKKQLSSNEDTKQVCVVPLHNKTIAIGTLKSILNQAGISIDDFIANL